MARRRPITRDMPDAVRDAVERTVQATLGQAQLGRGRAQDAVDELVRSAEAGAGAVRERVIGAFEAGRPATSEEMRAVRSELRTIARRLAAIERRLEERQPNGEAPPVGGRPDSAKGGAGSKGRARQAS
jgi:hypothetical protein